MTTPLLALLLACSTPDDDTRAADVDWGPFAEDTGGDSGEDSAGDTGADTAAEEAAVQEWILDYGEIVCGHAEECEVDGLPEDCVERIAIMWNSERTCLEWNWEWADACIANTLLMYEEDGCVNDRGIEECSLLERICRPDDTGY